jgi:hypothetical protein
MWWVIQDGETKALNLCSCLIFAVEQCHVEGKSASCEEEFFLIIFNDSVNTILVSIVGCIS